MVRTSKPRALPLLIMTALVVSWAFSPLRVEAQTERPHVPDEVIVKFADGATLSDVDDVIRSLQAVPVKSLSSIQAALYRVQTPVEEAVATWSGHPAIEFIEPNYLWYADETPNDPSFGQLWGLQNTGQSGGTPGADIAATNAWDVFTGNPDVVVGVIDTGVDVTHPDLAANIYTNPGEIPNNGIDDDNNGYVDDVHGWDFANGDNDPFDDVGHGTHVAGTIGAVGDNGIGVVGVNWDVKILPIKFLAPGGGSTANAILSVEYATTMGVDLTNNSWGGGGFSAALEAAIDAAGQAGILFVAAAGNASSNTDAFPHYPSSYDLPSIVSVAATDHNDQLAWFSNFGVMSVDLAAPGDEIFSTIPFGNYGFNSGTSMASPHVAGVLALMRGRSPGLPAATMKDLLLLNVDPVPALAGLVATGGRLNAFAALADPDSIPPAPVGDLEVVEVTPGNGVRLRWTASGDDGSDGTASYYDVRFSPSPLDDTNFDAASQAAGEPDPGPSGTVEEFVVEGLDFEVTYYMALRVLDEFGNASSVSNVVQAMTLPPPVIAVSPPALQEALLTGAASTQQLTIENTGASDLTFSVAILDQGASRPSTESIAARYPDAMVPVTSADGDRYDDGQPPSKPRPFSPSPSVTAASAVGWEVLILHAGDVSEIQSALLQFTDIVAVDALDGGMVTPTLDDLMAYDAVIVAPNSSLLDPSATGDRLADYVDAGGAVILTTPAHVSGWQLTGRFLSDGYSPFETGVGPIGSGSLGAFDATHPIMDGVASVSASLLATAPLAAGAQWVADWNIGEAFVATQGEHVVGVNVFVGGPGAWTGDVPLVLRNAINWASTIPWLTVAPDAGRIAAGGSMILDVRFDAFGLNGGGYDRTIAIASNDPLQPEVAVPAHLDVTGAPDVTVDPTALDYGVVFIGLSEPRTVSVCNPGTDLLQVLSVATDSPYFTADLVAFDLAPGACQDVVVTFAPDAVAPFAGTLTLLTNDPDEAQVEVALSGEGAECPVITVSPTQITSDLLTNESEVQFVDLGNTGGSDLVFSVGIQTPAQMRTLTPPMPWSAGPDGESAPSTPVRTTALEAALADLTGMDILWDQSRGQSFPDPWTTLISDLTSRGATLTPNVDPITSALLSDYDVLWSTDTPSSWTTAEMQAIASWIQSGGSLLLEGDNDSTVSAFNSLLQAVGAGIQLSTADGTSGTTTLIEPHASTEGVGSILFDANIASIASVAAPGQVLVRDVSSQIASAYAEVGSGSVLVVTDEVFGNSRMGVADNQLWGNQVFDWFQTPAWLAVEPTEGAVSPQGSLPLALTLDATGLLGGVYELEMAILSNDCVEPTFVVPVTLNVTGRPDLVVSETSIDFGTIFLGGSAQRVLTVTNAGTDLLTVTSVSVDDGAFVVDPTPFDLAPRTALDLVVTYAPVTLGPAAATLTLESNDPDGTEIVALQGAAIEPPDIDVQPTSLTEALFTGEQSMQTMVIANTGVSDLTFDLGIVIPPPASKDDAASAPVAVPRPSDPDRLAPDETAGPPVALQGASAAEAAQGVLLADDFEDGDFVGWQDGGGNWVKEVTSETAANGTVFSYHDTNGGGHFNGKYQDFGPAQPAYIGFWIRSGSRTTADAYVVLRDPQGNDIIWFFARDNGFLYVNADVGGSESFSYTANTWYHVEFREIDFTTKTFDFYVDETLILAGIPFRNAFAESLFRVDIYNWSSGGQAWWDEIYISTEAPAGWISLDPREGVVPPGGTVDVGVSFDATGLFGGGYDTQILVRSNDPDEAELLVPVHLEVTGVPRVAVEDTSVVFDTIFVGATDTRTVTVSNIGTDLLTVSAVSSDEPDFTADPSTFDVVPGQSQIVTVTFAPSRPGTIEGTLSVASNDPLEPVVTARLRGEALVAPDIAVSPPSLDESLPPEGTTMRTLTLHNEGGSDLAYEIGVGAGLPLSTAKEGGPVAAASLLHDDFEDGDFAGWTLVGNTSAKSVTAITAANGTQYSYHESGGNQGSLDGIRHDLGPGQPQYVSFWVRSGSTIRNDAYFVLWDSQSRLVALFFARSDGHFAINSNTGGNTTYAYQSNTWYHIELQNMDFTTHTFDYYVDGQLVQVGIPFRNTSAEDVARVHLYNYDPGTEAWWDEILISTEPGPSWLTIAPISGVIAAGDSAEVAVTFSAEGLDPGPYDATIVVESNDPDEPAVLVPAHLEVLSTTDVVEVAMGSGTGLVGSTVDVPLTLSRPGIAKTGDPSMTAALDVQIQWDPAVASLVDVTRTPATSAWALDVVLGVGSVQVSMASAAPIDVPPEGLDFLSFAFSIQSEGATPLTVVASELFDVNQEPIAHVRVDGNLAAGCDRGDVIADGEVNSADAIRGLLFAMDLLGPTPQEFCAADMNFDGAIEVGDVVLILQEAVGATPALSQVPARLFARAGNEVGTVLLRVAGAAGVDLVLTYDPAAVSFVSFTAPGSQGVTAANDEESGTLRVGFAKGVPYDGDLVLKFDVGDPHSTLRFQTVAAYDGAGRKQPVELVNNEFVFGATGADVPFAGRTRLLAAVPNPFNPTTQLRFVLGAPADAVLTVFNVAGRKVREFVLPGLGAGEHAVTWDGRDDDGRGVSSGSYLVRFEAGGQLDTGRVLLLK